MADHLEFEVSGWADADGQFFDVQSHPDLEPSEAQLQDCEYITVHVTDDAGDEYWVHLAGPFDDLEDIEEQVEYWYENGSG